jgi:hypothetical protein
VVRASRPNVQAKCASEGGTTANGYCRLPVPPSLTARASSSGTYKVLSINVGNADIWGCGSAAPPSYVYKLCSRSDEDKVRAELDAISASGKPDIIAFQELWHNDCSETPDNEFTDAQISGYGVVAPYSVRLANDRLCVNPDGSKQIERLINPTEYDYRCSPIQRFPSSARPNRIVNGYECVAFLRTQFTAVATDIVQPACNATTPAAGTYFTGSDTGWQVVTLRLVGAVGSPASEFDVVNGHLISPTDPTCRAKQFTALKDRYFLPLSTPTPTFPYQIPVAKRVLFVGDMNTDPVLQSNSDAGANAFRELFSDFGAAIDQKPYNKLAYMLDNPNELTAYAPSGPNWWRLFTSTTSLDHALSNFADGSCPRREAVANLDHKSTLCILKGFDSGKNTLSFVKSGQPTNASVVVSRKGVRLTHAYTSAKNHPSTGSYVPVLPDNVPVNLIINPCLLEPVTGGGPKLTLRSPQLLAGQNLAETIDLTSTPCQLVIEGKGASGSSARGQISFLNSSTNPTSYAIGWPYYAFYSVVAKLVGTSSNSGGPMPNFGVNGTLNSGQTETLEVSEYCTSSAGANITMSVKDLVTLEVQYVPIRWNVTCTPYPTTPPPAGYKYSFGCSLRQKGVRTGIFDPNNEQPANKPWAWDAGVWNSGGGFPSFTILNYGFEATEVAARNACETYGNSGSGKRPVLLVETGRATGGVDYRVYEPL